VLFLQKFNADPALGPLCPRTEDYPIFFATQQLPGKDTRGEKIIARDKDGKLLRDTHGHWVVQHDLFNHDGLTHDGIAEAFELFARKEKLSFFQ
jgi:type I restriction enzyme M protein